MAWVEISPEQAKQHEYYGFRGWLLVFYILDVGGCITIFSLFLNNETVRNLYGEQTTIMHGVEFSRLPCQEVDGFRQF